MLAGFCAFLDLYATQPLLPMLAVVFGASEVRVSLTVTLATAAVAFAAPFAGTISDRFGSEANHRVVVRGAGRVHGLRALSPDLNALLFWRFLQGVFTPGIFAVTIAYIHDEWHGSESGRATAAYVSGTVVGGFSGRFISGFVATHMSWQWVFVVLGVLNLCGAAAMWKWLPRERRQRIAAPVAGWAAVNEHLHNPLLLATYAVGFCVLFAMTAAFTYVTFYLAAPPFRLRPGFAGLAVLRVSDRSRHHSRFGTVDRPVRPAGGAGGCHQCGCRRDPVDPRSGSANRDRGAGDLLHGGVHCAGVREFVHRSRDGTIARWRSACMPRATTRAEAPVRLCRGWCGSAAAGLRALR
jgi:MFS family permease